MQKKKTHKINTLISNVFLEQRLKVNFECTKICKELNFVNFFGIKKKSPMGQMNVSVN